MEQLVLHKIIPAEVKGFYRRRRDFVHFFLMLIFLALPWIRVGSHQAVHLDIANRKFYFFGVLFQAHEAPLLFFLAAFSFLSLALVTSLWGRVWCGWACPQTVFIDSIFRRIEKWVEGGYLQRRKRQQQGLTLVNFLVKSWKWILFSVVSSLIAHSFIAYFVGAAELLEMMRQSPALNSKYFLLVTAVTLLVLFDFGWFREQFCVILCPYGRFQNVLLEPGSVTVAYDAKRGEPRREVGRREVGRRVPGVQNTGDCVSCRRCVEVCPTGIDIRNGLQLECINCTACMDACDDIMMKVNKPKGLIGYKTLNGQSFSFRSFKTFFYSGLMLLCVIGLTWSLAVRSDLDIVVLRGSGLPFSILKEEDQEVVLNHFKLHLTNQSSNGAEYSLKIAEPFALVSSISNLKLKAGEQKEWQFFVKVQKKFFQSKAKIQLQNLKSGQIFSKDITLVGPTE